MTGNVIEFRPRRANAADPAALVRAARGSISRDAVAAALSALLGWPVKPGMIRAWESGVPVPPDVVEACQTGAFRDHALAEMATAVPTAAADPERLAPPYLAGGPRPDAGLPWAEADARDVMAWVESTNISDDVIGYLTKATIKAAEDHITVPPVEMLGRVRQLHAMLTTLLRGGRQRIRQTRELLRLDAELLAHLCQLLGDIHRDRAASASGQAALVLAAKQALAPPRSSARKHRSPAGGIVTLKPPTSPQKGSTRMLLRRCASSSPTRKPTRPQPPVRRDEHMQP